MPLQLRLERGQGPLLPQINAALAAHGRPLRWAITAVESAAGVASSAAGDQASVLRIEAVVLA